MLHRKATLFSPLRAQASRRVGSLMDCSTLSLLCASVAASFTSEFAFACFGFGPAILYEISWQICSLFKISSGALEAAIWNIIIIELPTGCVQFFVVRKHFRLQLSLLLNLPFAATLILGTLALEHFGQSVWMKRCLGLIFLSIAMIKLTTSKTSETARPEIGSDSPWPREFIPLLIFAAMVSGLFRGLFGVAGPPLMILLAYYPIERSVWRCLSVTCRLTTVVAQGVLLGLNADFDFSCWPMYTSLMIGGLIGLFFGNIVSRYVDAETFQRWLLLFLISGALLMMCAGNYLCSLIASILVAIVVVAAAVQPLMSKHCRRRSLSLSPNSLVIVNAHSTNQS